MRQNHFLVSIKTVDDTPVFPKSFNGENYLFQAVVQAMNRTRVISKGFASFPTGFEAVICCKHDMEAKMFADAVATQIYEKNNSMGHIIDSFGIHIGKLTNDERTLYAVMTDMTMRSMAARGINMDDIPVIEMDMDLDLDGKALS